MASIKMLPCAPCKCRGISTSAVKYCTTCKEQLCKGCAELHKAFKATRKHLLVHSIDQQSKKMRHDFDLFQTCTEHLNKQTEFYCGDHEALLCSLCLLKSDNHKNCTKIVDIDISGKSFLDRKFTDSVKDSHQKMLRSATYTITNIKKAKACTSDNIKSLIIQIENVRRNMLEAFDRQTDHIIHAVSRDLVDNDSKCENASQSLQNLVKLAEGSDGLFQTVIDNGSSADVFRCVLSILGQCGEFQKELEQTKQRCSRLNVAVEKSDLVKMLETDKSPLLSCTVNKTAFDIPALWSGQLNEDFQNCISALTLHVMPANTNTKPMALTKIPSDEKCKCGDTESESNNENVRHAKLKPLHFTLALGKTSSDSEIERGLEKTAASLEQTLAKKLDSRSATKDIDIELSHSYSFDVPTSGDEIPWFSGIVCLSGDRLILSDFKNSRLVMVKKTRMIKEKKLDYMPGGITVFNKFLVVCLKEKNMLLLLKMEENSLKEYKYLPTGHLPKCVKTVDEDRLLVSCKSRKGTWQLELITLRGQNWHRTMLNIELTGIYDGHVLAIQYLPEVQDTFQLLHSCDEPGKLQCFRQDGGSAIFQYEVDDTTSLETDANGYIFIIRHLGEVQVLTPDGILVTSIHKESMKRLKFAALNEAKDKLFITTYKDSQIHVLDIRRL